MIDTQEISQRPTTGAHKCPICGGNGLVPNGFYSRTNETWNTSSTAPEACQSCNGSGIVWSRINEG